MADKSMIPPASTDPMHCDHECVCPEITGIERSRKEPCDMKGTRAHCPHDTRARGPVQQAPAISRNLQKIKQCSSEMKYLSDEEIISRCLSMMAAMFSANADRKKEPVVFFDE